MKWLPVWILLSTCSLSGEARGELMYFPRPYSTAELKAMRADGLVEIGFETGQGAQSAFYRGPEPGKAPPEKVWLLFGGNGARAADYRDLAARAADGYLFVDYPGYGNCSGKASPRQIDANIRGAVAALAAHLELDEEMLQRKLCAFGHSLGAAAALRAAVEFEIGDLVLVSPFTTMGEMAERVVGKVLSKALLHRYNNIKKLAALVAKRPDARVVIFHGSDDRAVPVAMGRRLAKPHPKQVEFRLVPGADHNRIVSRKRAAILASMAKAQPGRRAGAPMGSPASTPAPKEAPAATAQPAS